jgi:ubiquinone/menaquinone biosynthesis C-methylase UbiE
VKAYYEARAEEYDDWWVGAGLFEQRVRPGWESERESLFLTLAALQPVPTLDVACGTGYLTRYLPGRVTCLDQSPAMLEVASTRVPAARLVQSDALPLPFADRSFGRVFTSHFYGHLKEDDRVTFLAEARRVAPELVIVDSALREDVEPVEWQERVLNDGTRWKIYKRYFEPDELAAELGNGEVLFAGRWFVAVRTSRSWRAPGGARPEGIGL